MTLQREWGALAKTAELRRTAAGLLLDHLLSTLPPGTRGTDLPAMTILLKQEQRGFARADFASLQLHYGEQIRQIHVMAEYAQHGLSHTVDHLKLAMDHFILPENEFLDRIAYLIRVRRQNPRGILALAYNRHAAVEIRRRLQNLVGDDARGVTVLTCHALAMRLVGASFAGRANRLEQGDFQEVIWQAVALLRGEGLPSEEADEHRGRLLAGFRWILVDEYQDIGPDQYELISALAGRTLSEADDRLSLFAVGDDDQNIYAFNGASTEFIRRFETDYGARPSYLTDDYRSTGNIIAAANAVIEPSRDRMKGDIPSWSTGRGRRILQVETGPCWTRWPGAACKSCRLAPTQSPRHRRRWPSMCWRPAALRLRWTALSNGWPSGAGKCVAASAGCCCSRPTGPRGWSLTTSSCSTEVGIALPKARMPRRLYYVAMTRAKQTLTLMRFPGRHRFQDALLNTSSALLQREPAALTPPVPELSRRYQRLSLRDVVLGFGGYRGRSIQCMPPSPRFRPSTRFRRVWRRIVGSCWTRAVRSWDNW